MKATRTERELSDSDDSNMVPWCLLEGMQKSRHGAREV